VRNAKIIVIPLPSDADVCHHQEQDKSNHKRYTNCNFTIVRQLAIVPEQGTIWQRRHPTQTLVSGETGKKRWDSVSVLAIAKNFVLKWQ